MTMQSPLTFADALHLVYTMREYGFTDEELEEIWERVST